MTDQVHPGKEAPIEGQLSPKERAFISEVVKKVKPQIAIEIGTWLGGGSTLHILRTLQANATGHLWGIEVDRGIYEQMLANIRAAAPEAADRFTPLFGFSTQVIPEWLSKLPSGSAVDLAFLDGGDNPQEQIDEFKLLAARVRQGGVIMAHDARTRKGKWFAPYISLLDNWEVEIFDFSFAGLLYARKKASEPSRESFKVAQRKLSSMRRQPKELVARLLPRQVNGFILGIMPERLKRRLTIEA